VEPECGGGLLLLRHVTPLPRRDVVYFYSGAHLNAASEASNFTVNWHGQNFAYTLIAGAVGTFVWQGYKGSTYFLQGESRLPLLLGPLPVDRSQRP
jgi:hypothetical protein